jgi:hypothetical protein
MKVKETRLDPRQLCQLINTSWCCMVLTAEGELFLDHGSVYPNSVALAPHWVEDDGDDEPAAIDSLSPDVHILSPREADQEDALETAANPYTPKKLARQGLRLCVRDEMVEWKHAESVFVIPGKSLIEHELENDGLGIRVLSDQNERLVLYFMSPTRQIRPAPSFGRKGG